MSGPSVSHSAVSQPLVSQPLVSPGGGTTGRPMPDARRWLRLALAATWLLDAALQFQPFMFTGAFGRTLAESAAGNPAVIAHPIVWSAGIIGRHPVATNAAFATIQLLLALGIAWRPAVRFALAASVVWSVAVWWLGEGLGGVLTGGATPWNGAPGAVILYALLAVLLWPDDRDAAAPFAAGRPVGRLPARLLWLVLWASMAYFALQASMPPDVTHGVLTGQQGSAVLAIACEAIALGIFMPPATVRIAVVLAVLAAGIIWVAGESFGAIFSGSATDPNSGLLLALLAVAYWPARIGQSRPVLGLQDTGIAIKPLVSKIKGKLDASHQPR